MALALVQVLSSNLIPCRFKQASASCSIRGLFHTFHTYREGDCEVFRIQSALQLTYR